MYSNMRQKITLTVESAIVQKVDSLRGDINRSIFIQRILEKSLKLPKS